MLLEHKHVPKSWGWEEWIVNNEHYCGKFLFVAKDKYCSYHYHKLKTETFTIVQGGVVLRYSYQDDINQAAFIILDKGQTFHIPVGLRHRFIGIEDSLILEISTHHEDSDSYRVGAGDSQL
jgi:quercetin dioxygenase-like cupin family protein